MLTCILRMFIGRLNFSPYCCSRYQLYLSGNCIHALKDKLYPSKRHTFTFWAILIVNYIIPFLFPYYRQMMKLVFDCLEMNPRWVTRGRTRTLILFLQFLNWCTWSLTVPQGFCHLYYIIIYSKSDIRMG